MKHYFATYRRADWVGLSWVLRHCEMGAPEIYNAIKRGAFPPPSLGIVVGVEMWHRREVLDWVEQRDVRRTLRA